MIDYSIIPSYPGILKWVEIEDKITIIYNTTVFLALDLNLTPILQNTQMRQVGSVNGLICQCLYSLEHDNTYICNRVTREYMILPTQRFQTHVYGFRVSSLIGECKVVRTFQMKVVGNGYAARPIVLEADVYTLGTGQWRSLGRVPITYWLNTFHQLCGSSLHNYCHWIRYPRPHWAQTNPRQFWAEARLLKHAVRGRSPRDLYFDLDKGIFQLLPSPPPPVVKEYGFHGQTLGILKGCVCKLDTYHSELTIDLGDEGLLDQELLA
ncbi:LOW QUALITY PROTEIN: hypothetical protein OSB04_016192 [Centaurea solstitialis]|uniref:F-box protein n=1 Tax=Centaurea solstitialis TaxID=347529 RepID=A0AA38TIM5_9ASTR|nr:LOW QUALITY PROTEIN: hypothetical protein OSB04_016192 [Centaurea solstitialis]